MSQYFKQLAKVYNTLSLVSTKGEDTIIMGQCLTALKDILVQIQENTTIKNETSVD